MPVAGPRGVGTEVGTQQGCHSKILKIPTGSVKSPYFAFFSPTLKISKLICIDIYNWTDLMVNKDIYFSNYGKWYIPGTYIQLKACILRTGEIFNGKNMPGLRI